jgi:hypothetical protein
MNTRTLDRLENSFFNVEKLGNSIVDLRTHKEIASVSDKYTLVKNKDLISPIIEVLGIDSLESINMQGSYNWVYTFNTGRQFEIVPGDIINERLIVQNSYDKSRSFAFMLGAFRFVCTNGLYTGTAHLNYKSIHVGDIPVDDLVSNALNSYECNQFSHWSRLADIELDLDQELDILNGFRAFEVKNSDYASNQTSYWALDKRNDKLNYQINRRASQLVKRDESIDNHRSIWGLYNALNAGINYAISDRQINTKILANKRAEAYCLSLLEDNKVVV